MGSTYKDIPRGPIKDNWMRKLACKTLMEILPTDVANSISQEIADKKLSIASTLLLVWWLDEKDRNSKLCGYNICISFTLPLCNHEISLKLTRKYRKCD